MSTVNERKKIVEEIVSFTESIKQIDETLKSKFSVSKNLASSTYLWEDVSMMYREGLIDNEIYSKLEMLHKSVSNLKESSSSLLSMLQEED
jgi:hypothetical protein